MIRKFLIAMLSVVAVVCASLGLAGCSSCDSEEENHVHTYGSWQISAENTPTLTQAGKAVRVCSACGYEQELTLPVLTDDAYTITDNTATTTTTGEGTYMIVFAQGTVTDVDYELTLFFDAVTAKLEEDTSGDDSGTHAHTYGEYSVTTAPTDTATGIATSTCSGCDVKKTITLPVLTDVGYTITNNTATATEAGTGTYTITISGVTISFTAATPATGAESHTHEYGEYSVTTAPTDTATGIATSTCSGCDDTKTITLPVLTDVGYTITNNTATATEAGTGTYTITISGVTISFTAATPATGTSGGEVEEHTHTYGSWEITTVPTQTTTGAASRSCTSGDDTQTLTLPVLGDSGYTITNNTATATEVGTGTYTIAISGVTISFTAATPATGTSGGDSGAEHTHSYSGSWEVTVYPTELTEGTAIRVCSCGEKQSVTLPVLGDSGYTTVTSSGVITYTITVAYEGTNYQVSFSLDASEVTYTVSFVSGGSTISTQTVSAGEVATSVTPASQTGKYFSGWYTSESYTTAFDFTTAINADTTLYAKWVELNSAISYLAGNSESIAVEWTDSNAASAKVYYKLASESSWYSVDDSNIRAIDSTTLRADVLGLVGGETYDIRVVTSGNETINQSDITVSSYDRSGYAHYNYTDGVGAYEDDGTLKDGALVIYLTEDNKNDVSGDCYVYDADTKTYTKTDITQYLYCSVTENITLYGSGAMVGIGEILNNRRYSGNDRHDVGIAKLCEVYGAVAIRVVGTVTADVNSDGTSTITGLTDYDSTGNGGSEGDNGRMARMVNAKNLTIEGVGEDASIYGWGIHFISSATNSYEGSGTSFEVRNITFESYPEDAIGMEGEQYSASASSYLSASVERCWVHNNSFLPGYCANPAESDKSEGDGSCDFKRGQYYTLSYNYFEYCHKTNLIGSSSDSLQFNITMHHNYWYNCGSRIPLVRQANVHYYNNYIYGDSTDDNASLSYVISARADSYVFAEANYFDGTKNPVQLKAEGYNNGAVKEYNNVYYAATGDNLGTTVTSRTESVSNSCEFSYYKIDYSSFDTDSSLFYYDETNQCSDCYLTDAVTARQVVMQTAGVQKRNTETVDTNMSWYSSSASTAVDMDGATELDVDLTKATAGGYINNIYFSVKGSSSGLKGKGQVITFTLANETQVTVEVSGTAEANLGELVRSDGTVYGSKFTSITVTLPAGTYFIGAGDKSKEVCVTKLYFKDSTTDEDKVNNVISLISAIGEVTLSSGDAISSARTSYDSLTTTLKSSVTNYETLVTAESAYSALVVNNVISLIDAIGTVGESSGTAIKTARAAYNALSTTQQALVTNYSTLTAAEEAYEKIAVTATINAIEKLTDTSNVSGEDNWLAVQTEYNAALALYNALSEDQQKEVENYSKLSSGLAAIEQALILYDFVDAVEALPTTLTTSDISAMSTAQSLYASLTSDQLTELASSYADIKTKYESLCKQYTELLSSTTVAIFAKDVDLPDNFTVTNGNYDSKTTFEYDGTTYNPLKMESSTEITLVLASEMTVTIKLSTANAKIKIDGTSYTSDSDGVYTITLEAGTYTLTKNTSCNLYYIILTP